eukprot:UN13984
MSELLLSELWIEFKRTKTYVDSMREKLSSNNFTEILGEDRHYQIEKLKMLQKMDQEKSRLKKLRKKRKEKLRKAWQKVHKMQKRIKRNREEILQAENLKKKREELLRIRASIRSEDYFSLVPGVQVDESKLREAVSRLQKWDTTQR